MAPCSLGRRRDAISSICKRSNRISLVSGLFVPLERHSHNRGMYTYARMHMCTLMSTRARTIVSFVLASASYPRLFILGALCSHLGTLPNQRDAIFAVAFQLTCEYRSTLVMAHSSNDVIALNLYREQRRKNSRKRQLPVLPIIFRTWLEEIDRSPRPFLKSCPRNLNTQRMARMFFFLFFFH